MGGVLAVNIKSNFSRCSLDEYREHQGGEKMWNEPTFKDLLELPRLYSSQDVPPEAKIIRMHFFIGGSDWYICEWNGDDLFYGFAILNQDYQMTEWGYVSFPELKRLRIGWLEVDRDLHWHPRSACEVEEICLAHGWPRPWKEAGQWLSFGTCGGIMTSMPRIIHHRRTHHRKKFCNSHVIKESTS